MRIGVLGAGWAGSVHAKMYARMADVNLAGIVGRTKAKVEEVSARLGVPAFTDPYSILDDPTVDAVSVCYRTFMHHDYAIAALERGKHVFCETPLAMTLPEADAMIAASRASGRLLLVASVMRFVGAYVYIQEMIQSHQLGQPWVVLASRLSNDRRRSPRPAEEFGPPVVELMIHDFDYLYWLLGKPTAVRGTGLPQASSDANHAFVTLEYQGLHAQVEGSMIMPVTYPFSTRLRVICARGAIETSFRVRSDGPPETVITRYPEAGSATTPDILDQDPYWLECRRFVDCVAGKADPALLSAEAARGGLQMALAAKESLERGGERVVLT